MGIDDILDSDRSKILLLLAAVATVLFYDVVRVFIEGYTTGTKLVLLAALGTLIWILYVDVDGDDRGMTTPYDLFVRPLVGAYKALTNTYDVLKRGYEAETPDSDDGAERAQIGTLLDIILIFLKPAIQWAVDNWEFLVMLGIVLWALDASGYYPAVQILTDFVSGVVNWVISFVQDVVKAAIDWVKGELNPV